MPKEGCWINVAGETRQWEANKALVLDTTFEHSTGNESGEDRYVLIIDFWHPGLTQAERDALSVIFELRNEFEGRGSGQMASVVQTPPPPRPEPVASGGGLMGAFKGMFGGK